VGWGEVKDFDKLLAWDATRVEMPMQRLGQLPRRLIERGDLRAAYTME
jgi:hypothetical protein